MKTTPTRWLKNWTLILLILITACGSASATDYRSLTGRWQRTDGSYILEIRRIAPNGTMEAAYFNPRPIHVSQAEASLFKNSLKVEIELRDTGYPGSTYTLLYDPDKDVLLGFYFQAVHKQNYDVAFVRMGN